MSTIPLREIDIKSKAVSDDSLSEVFAYYCHFCEKKVKTDLLNNRLCEKLVKSKNFYCSFCVRNKFFTKKKRDILKLSFRGIIGYLYWRYYRTKDKKIYLSEIKDMINSHIEVGLENPLFSYDPETFIWFVDFSSVGISKRKVPVEEIYKTVINILVCFNLYESTTGGVQGHKLYEKFREAIELFYKQRKRPEGKTLLVPTLSKCGGTFDVKFDYNRCRDFLPKHLVFR